MLRSVRVFNRSYYRDKKLSVSLCVFVPLHRLNEQYFDAFNGDQHQRRYNETVVCTSNVDAGESYHIK
jgi:hypothetical protein